ncbi:MAG TPA: 30S ribosomal protein S21 [Bacteroidia bacterium]|nr:30S ribosomal protein S21 [Sphingobacteriales bacterium]HPD66225.1 30S ribosomal protein S21 [Bacteroidia bacterium]HRS59025.1 30S ribosomal protein S21 [Bacteroidia bacterium]HRU68095.1 30S ribosomal protein S21 [Bacteroidia bacterium]
MITVQVSDNESIDKALKRFKKKLEKSGVLKEYRNRRFFTKKSIERRNEIGRAAFRQRLASMENK